MGMVFSSVLGLKSLANGMGQDGMGCMYTRDISWVKKVILMFIILNISIPIMLLLLSCNFQGPNSSVTLQWARPTELSFHLSVRESGIVAEKSGYRFFSTVCSD
jgi:hypothetical protein